MRRGATSRRAGPPVSVLGLLTVGGTQTPSHARVVGFPLSLCMATSSEAPSLKP